jgi:hypothetical protein
MFEFKHLIEFQNKDTFRLFGEDFWGDKSTFWESHQTSLNELYKKVINSDFPIKIIDLKKNSTLLIQDLNEFKDWLKTHQPFSDKLKSIESRSELIYSEILKNCKLENTNEFEFYWEIWGVMWYPWTIEINKKFQTFSLNDISEDDLTELIKLKKIELIKTYEKSEMNDEFDRKRYKINGR